MSGALRVAVLDALNAIGRAPSVLKVGEQVRRFGEAYGFSRYLCSAPPRPDEDPDEHLLFHNWPQEWFDRYVSRNYVERDPMVRTLLSSLHPFTWDEALERGRYSSKDLEIVHEARAWGMCKGFVVPIYGLGGQAHAVTLAGRDPRLDPQARAELHLVAMYAYGRAKQIKRRRDPPIPLTRRQAEVLQWAALGKSDWEVGEVLGLSSSTVHKHVEAAKRRFGVATRVQAILGALKHGHIKA